MRVYCYVWIHNEDTAMSFIDFREIKSRFTIEQVKDQLGLELKQHGEQYRGACPACGEGGDRALVITPRMKVFYCFAGKTGGDIIALASHILGVGPKDAALAIAEYAKPELAKPEPKKATVPEKSQGEAENVLQPLAHLEIGDSVTALLRKEQAEAVGIGFCNRGMMRGYVVFPLRLPDGTLTGYLGVNPATKEIKLPPKGLRL